MVVGASLRFIGEMYFLGALIACMCIVGMINFSRRYRIKPAAGLLSLLALELGPEWISRPGRWLTVMSVMAHIDPDDRFVVMSVILSFLPAREYTQASILCLSVWMFYRVLRLMLDVRVHPVFVSTLTLGATVITPLLVLNAGQKPS